MIDVLICCHDDADLLPRALDGLANQTAPRGSFRVIVVDNASTDDPRSVVARYSDRLDIEYVYEPVLGLNRARNTGHQHATSRYVAHVDGDSIPDPGWVDAILDVTTRTDCDLCGGPYRAYYVCAKPPWFEDRFVADVFGETPRELQGREHPHGMNMIWKKETVARLGGFRTDIGLHGRGLARGDETELVARGRRSPEGLSVYFDPRISVQTVVRPEVLSFRYWMRRAFVHGRTCRDMWGALGPGMSWPWPLRGAAALALSFLAVARVPFRSRRHHRHARTFLFDKLLPHLFHVGSAYQDGIDLLMRRRERRS